MEDDHGMLDQEIEGAPISVRIGKDPGDRSAGKDRRRGKDSNKINWLYARFLSMKYALSPNNRHIT